MKCQFCDADDHPWWNCRKRPTGWAPPAKSTAARKDVPGKTTVRDALAQIGDDPVKAAQPPVSEEAAFASTGDSIRKRVPEVSSPAGTQAPPVDTDRKRGRPPTGFDKKAYDREYAATRRRAKARS